MTAALTVLIKGFRIRANEEGFNNIINMNSLFVRFQINLTHSNLRVMYEVRLMCTCVINNVGLCITHVCTLRL